jgi:hypothetical protein
MAWFRNYGAVCPLIPHVNDVFHLCQEINANRVNDTSYLLDLFAFILSVFLLSFLDRVLDSLDSGLQS